VYIDTLDYSQLPKLGEEVRLHFTAGRKFNARNAKTPYIPTLEVNC